MGQSNDQEGYERNTYPPQRYDAVENYTVSDQMVPLMKVKVL